MNPLSTLKERTRAKLLGDFSAFARRAWREVEPKELQWNWHHELICEYLQLAYERQELRLIITQPPRTLKSRLVSIFFPAWVWAKDPGQSFILTSYSDSLSEELNVSRRNLLTSRWFQETFPGKVQFSPDQNRKEQFQNLAGGMAIATSVFGTLTGKGADFLLVDDLLSPQQSYSDLERENANRFFDSTLRSRLNVPTTGAIICISQRLHESDLPGHLLANEPGAWTHVCLPMIAETDEVITFPISGRVINRKAGDLLHPTRFPKSWCDKTRATVGPFIWAGQYQQRPGPAGGAIFKREWFQSYKKEPDKGSTVISLDTAFSLKKTADYSAASVWTVQEGRYYLRFVWRGRVEYPQLKKMAEEFCDFWRPEAVLIEERASGQSLLQSLQQETSLPVVGVPADVDKVSRAHGVTGLFESGRVYFPEDAPWLPTFLHELELFPSGAHDDQVDSIVQALKYLRSRQYEGGLGLVDLIKRKALAIKSGVLDAFGMRTQEKIPVAVEVAGIGHAKPPGVSRDQWREWNDGHRAPACPHPECKATCTVWQSDGRGGLVLHCNQCQRNDGKELPKPVGTCCGNFLPQMISGFIRCGNCGAQSSPQGMPTNGVSRQGYGQGAGRRRGFGRFG